MTPGRDERLAGITSRYREILGHTGSVSVLSGLLIASPALAAFAFPAEVPHLPAFLLPGGALALLGFALRRLRRNGVGIGAIGLAEASVVVLLSWILAVAFAAVPFVWVGGLDVTQAVFESTSGWTTTGLSVVDVSAAHPTILLLRSVLQLAGGAGLAILMISALVGPLGTGISSAEGREELLVPLVDRSAKLVVRIYVGYAIVGTVALKLAGMSWFDAVNHSFTAISTGGFSTRPESIGAWDSAAIEAVTIPLMVLGNLSFVTAWAALQGRWRNVVTNGEVRTSLVLGVVGVFVIAVGVARHLFPSGTKVLRVAVFETVTAVTTTGFSTVGYVNWPAVGWSVLIVFMIIGGGAGSTAGGVKQYRAYVLYRHLRHELARRLGPRRSVGEAFLREGGERRFLTDAEVARIGTFVFLYLSTLAVGTTVVAGYGYGFRESLFEFSSALGTVGLSVGVTSAATPPGALWAETVGMFLGRLEFFTVFVGGARLFQDGRFALRAARDRRPAAPSIAAAPLPGADRRGEGPLMSP